MNRAQLKQRSKNQLKGNWKVPVLIMLIYSVSLIILSMIQNNFDSTLGIFIGFLISIVFEVWAFVGLSKFFLKFIEKQGKATFEDVLVSKCILLKSLGFIILMSIVGMIIGIIIGFSIIAFVLNAATSYGNISVLCWLFGTIIIALAIMVTIISLAISMTSYILVEKEELGLFEAIGLSIKMMKGHKWELFLIQLSFIGWAILTILTLGIGYLWLA
ncbi:MAG: DUF975 family protein, partial [Romboutsia sp.]|uniref:DUF975 family protein n=1 Tax=Romboutsia sp. TaxID=1965302 RepID=UPI003F3DA210